MSITASVPPLYEDTVFTEAGHLQLPLQNAFTQNVHHWNLLFTVSMFIMEAPSLIGLLDSGYSLSAILCIIFHVFFLFTAVSRNRRCLRIVGAISLFLCANIMISFFTLLITKLFFEAEIKWFLNKMSDATYMPGKPDPFKVYEHMFDKTWSFVVLELNFVFSFSVFSTRACLAKLVIAHMQVAKAIKKKKKTKTQQSGFA